MTQSLTLHRAMFDAVRARDLEALRDMYHPEYSYTGADGVPVHGPAASVRIVDAYTRAFPDLQIVCRHEFAAGAEHSVIEFTVAGTHRGPLHDIPATGRSIEIAACNVVEIRDGRILREREYFDTHALLHQLGAF